MTTSQSDSDIAEEELRCHFDPLKLSALADPSHAVKTLLQRFPVTHSDQHDGFWVVSRRADVTDVAIHPEVFSSEVNGAAIPNLDMGIPRGPIEVDPPLHEQYRGPLMKRFSPQAVKNLEPEMRATAIGILDELANRSEVDLAEEFTIPYPAQIVTRYLGFPVADIPMLVEWAEGLLSGELERQITVAFKIFEYLAEAYERLENDDGDDVINLVRKLVIDGEPIALPAFQGAMLVLFTAGLDTTSNAAAHIIDLLDRHRDIRSQLINEPDRIPRAIEEFLRFISPIPMLGRTAVVDTEIGGCPVKKDEKVGLMWIAANHDPEEFDQPGVINIDRYPNRHVAFGAGLHRCLGAHLAKLELHVMLEEFLRRFPDYEVEQDRVVRASGITRHIASLPVRLNGSASPEGSSR